MKRLEPGTLVECMKAFKGVTVINPKIGDRALIVGASDNVYLLHHFVSGQQESWHYTYVGPHKHWKVVDAT